MNEKPAGLRPLERYVIIHKPERSRGGDQEMTHNKWTAAGCFLWIAGLAAFIIGLNLNGEAKGWMTVAGSVCFLIGLGISGAVWMKRKQKEE